ncbi:MAG: CooT family nickel-binding protein [Promethearchaeota archaeon]|nr:MAG: CooT family nickel-binding protein [Candidatus Lokiarchaeota archaeon]
MCEFKIIKKNDGSQILEDVVVLSYTEDHQLLFRDVMGAGETLRSAVILDVNTLNQTCEVYEHELIQPFFELMTQFQAGKASAADIELFQKKLNKIKKEI